MGDRTFATRQFVALLTTLIELAIASAIAFAGIGVLFPSASAAQSGCGSASVTLKNNNTFPIWVGENITQGSILPLPSGGWMMGANGSGSDTNTLCIPSDWTSGTFWARTECNFDLFKADPDSDYLSCTSATQCCQSGHQCSQTGQSTLNNHICYGGKCLIDCSTATGTNGNCSGLPNSVCVAAAGSTSSSYAAGSYCGFVGGVCRTGDCGSGLYQCQGTWDKLSADFGPATPAGQFEITTTSSADGGLGAATYDVTNISGYNNAISVAVTGPGTGGSPGSAGNPACFPTGCNTDLNSVCPSLLQVIEPPIGSGGNCGGGSCATGYCEPCPSNADPSSSCVNHMTCVIGCNAPGKLCGSSYPSPISAPGVANLSCNSAIPNGSVHGTQFTADGAEYRDMYDAANDSGTASTGASHIGVTMFSGNQGTPTCWGDVDCAIGEKCLVGSTATGIAGLPSYVGICVTPSAGGGLPTVAATTDCANPATDIGNNCGGYPNSPVYSCMAASNVSPALACLPAPYNNATQGLGAVTVGLGPYDSISGFFEGIGAPINPEWEYAAFWASGNGSSLGATPYYEAFSNACPHQYAWTYDDHAGGLSCNGYPIALNVTFGPTSTATATPTATPTPTPGATPHPAFFAGENSVGGGLYFLTFRDQVPFGYYTYAFFPFLYHFDLGWEFFIDAQNSRNGAYFYDIQLNSWLYTDPELFPFLYEFSEGAWYYYFYASNGHYTSNPRWFFDFKTLKFVQS